MLGLDVVASAGLPQPVSPQAPASCHKRPRRAGATTATGRRSLTGPQPLQLVVHQYSNNGSHVAETFEDGKPAYAILLAQQGSSKFPTVLSDLKTNVLAFLRANVADQPMAHNPWMILFLGFMS